MELIPNLSAKIGLCPVISIHELFISAYIMMSTHKPFYIASSSLLIAQAYQFPCFQVTPSDTNCPQWLGDVQGEASYVQTIFPPPRIWLQTAINQVCDKKQVCFLSLPKKLTLELEIQISNAVEILLFTGNVVVGQFFRYGKRYHQDGLCLSKARINFEGFISNEKLLQCT